LIGAVLYLVQNHSGSIFYLLCGWGTVRYS
jgi:hypothetical protein